MMENKETTVKVSRRAFEARKSHTKQALSQIIYAYHTQLFILSKLSKTISN